MKKHYVYKNLSGLIFSLLLVVFAVDSKAVTIFEHAEVNEGVVTIEVGAEYETDEDDPTKDNNKKALIGIEYGLSDSWELGLELGGAERNGLDKEFELTAFETTYQFTEQDSSNPVSSGVNFQYEMNDKENDEVYLGLLFEHRGKQFDYLINAGISHEVEDQNKTGNGLIGDIRVMAKYNFSPYFQPGVEYFSNTGELEKLEDYEDQANRLGPAIYGFLSEYISYEAAYLFGITDTAEDVSVRALIRARIPFNEPSSKLVDGDDNYTERRLPENKFYQY